MDGIPWPDFSEITLGSLAFLILIAGAKGWWVFGKHHDAMVTAYEVRLARKQAESDQWRDLALAQLGVMEETVERATRLVVKAKEATDEAPT